MWLISTSTRTLLPTYQISVTVLHDIAASGLTKSAAIAGHRKLCYVRLVAASRYNRLSKYAKGWRYFAAPWGLLLSTCK